MRRAIKFKQIAVGQYRSENMKTLSFVPLGLGVDGKVYKFLFDEGWVTLERAVEIAHEKQNERDEDIQDGMGDNW